MLTAQEKFDAAERLRDNNQAEQAIPLYYQVFDDDSASAELRLRAQHMLGVCYRMTRDFEASEEWLLAARDTAIEMGDHKSMVVAITNDLAETMRQKDDLGEARRYFQMSLGLIGAGNSVELGVAYGFAGRIELSGGNLTGALAYFHQSDDYLSDQDDRRPRLHMLPYWAEAAAKDGRFIESRSVAGVALAESLKLKKRDRAAQAALMLIGGPRLAAWVAERRKK